MPEQHLVIVGAGLVGATLASLLLNNEACQSLKITLIDRSAAPQLTTKTPHEYDARVVALTLASQNILRRLNVWHTIEQYGICHYEHMVVWDNDGTGKIDFHAHDIGQAALGSIVENSIALHSVLTTLAHHKNLTIIRGQSVQSVEQLNEHVNITLDNGHTITASLAVAADGGLSKVRELAGFKLNESSYNQSAIIATVKTECSHQKTAWQNFLSTGPLAVLPLYGANECHSAIVWSADTPFAETLMAMSENSFNETLSLALEYRFGKMRVEGKRFCIPLVARHAQQYFDRRVVLVGDAAHTIHPLAGQGVNLGLLDAQSLADEIIRAQRRQLSISDTSVLRRYQRQRKIKNHEMLLLMQSFKALFGQRSPWVRLARNYGLTAFNTITPIKHWLAKQASGI